MTSKLILPNRRELLQGGAALGAAGAMGGLMAGPAFAQTPQRGGRCRAALAEGSTSDSLDPQTYTDIYMISVGFATHSTLTEIAPNGDLMGDAAASWEGQDKAAKWVFKLRPEATFSDGKKVTAEDVIASINHHRGEASKSAAKDIVDPIADITADDAETVVFTLDGPNADFPFLMADYHLLIMPANPDGTANWRDYIGSGGYVLESFDPGVRTFLTRRDDYWKEDRGWFDELEILYIPDVTARQNSLQTGDVDMMSRVDLKTAGLMERRPGVRVEEATGFLHYTFPMLTDTNPYDSNELRLALKHGIDREQMLDRIVFGRGVIGNDHPIAPSVPYHNADLEQRVYDPEKAKYHLKRAGYDSIDVEISAADAAYAGAVDATVLYREHLAPSGINLRINRVPNDGYWSDVWLKHPWCACYWGGRPTCDWMFSQAYAAGANWNDTNWENERFNELLLTGRGELNEENRAEIYGEMQQLVRDEGGVVVWAFANYVYAMAEKVTHGPDVAANWALDGGRWVERWWFS